MIKILIPTVILAIGLAGCNSETSQAKVSCSSPETIATLKQAMFKKVRTPTADYTPPVFALTTSLNNYQVSKVVTDGGTDTMLTCEAHLSAGGAFGLNNDWLYAVKTADDGSLVVNAEPTN